MQVSPRTVREINIPVKDEELRSVNDQLRKLPSTRPHTAESTVINMEILLIFLPCRSNSFLTKARKKPVIPYQNNRRKDGNRNVGIELEGEDKATYDAFRPTVDKLREKALPQLPPNQKHKEVKSTYKSGNVTLY